MNNKGKKICIICEGYEEQEYIDALVKKNIFSSKYNIIAINAKSNNNIMARYQQQVQSDLYYIVLVFCDTDKTPYTTYMNIKQNINSFHGKNVADDVVIFGNPCTMQIILSHFCNVKLKSQSKKINGKYIEEFVGIVDYDATDKQRKELFNRITKSNYQFMKTNVANLSTSDTDCSSTNILKYLKYFENDDDSWIDEINNKIYD